MADAIGLIALSLTCLNGSVKGLALLSKASHYTQDVSNVQLQLELELHSLWTWAEAVGLLQNPPTLLINARNAPFVPRILEQLETLLTDLDQMKRRYGLEVGTTSETLDILDDENSVLRKLGPKFHAFLCKIQMSFIPNKVGGPLKRLRWVALDEQKFAKLLQDVSSYTTRLEKFLESSVQERRFEDLDSLLREAVLNVDDNQKLTIIGQQHENASSNSALAASTRLKQAMLKLGLSELHAGVTIHRGSMDLSASQLDAASGAISTSMRLKMRDLTISSTARTHKCMRHLAYYKNRVAVLEWRHASEMSSTAIEMRVDKVAAFLYELDVSFHSLPCRGYVKDRELKRYGYVFDLPDMLQPPLKDATIISNSLPSSSAKPDMRSLFNLMGDRTVPKPSLNVRMSIAKILVESLLNLHTAGWFHKELRSENIILIRKSELPISMDPDLSSASVFVAGYTFARPRDRVEMSEPFMGEGDDDLYRHPLSVGYWRLPFHKNFDIFTVACVLLEIGLWMRLQDLLEREALKHLNDNTTNGSVANGNLAGSSKAAQTLSPTHRQGTVDFMELRHDLLLSPLKECKIAQRDSRSVCKLLRLLEAAVGNAYTDLVEELLSITIGASTQPKEQTEEDQENTLDLEIKARNVIQKIYNAI